MSQTVQESLWDQVKNKCLSSALALLESETAPTAATVEAVSGLVQAAVMIDTLNLHWAQQTRYGAAVFRGQTSVQQEGGN